MNPENDTPGSADEFDEPYVHIVSTEEFVEAVEQATQNENDELLASHQALSRGRSD